MAQVIGLMVRTQSGPGVMHQLTGVVAGHEGNITSVEIVEHGTPESRIYFEIEMPGDAAAMISAITGLAVVLNVELVKSLKKIYGKRIIIIGGGAQVGQVAIGAISEADRHNIRGEHISIDTIPLL